MSNGPWTAGDDRPSLAAYCLPAIGRTRLRYGRSSMQGEQQLADPTRSHMRYAASIVCPGTVAQPILSLYMDAARMMTGNFNRSTFRQYLPGPVSPHDNEHKRNQSPGVA
jgi:hypothetical protein